jgi:hypothetical protein
MNGKAKARDGVTTDTWPAFLTRWCQRATTNCPVLPLRAHDGGGAHSFGGYTEPPDTPIYGQ